MKLILFAYIPITINNYIENKSIYKIIWDSKNIKENRINLYYSIDSGINWKIAFKVFSGWIITLIVVGGTSALITAQGIYAPSKNGECLVYMNITD